MIDEENEITVQVNYRGLGKTFTGRVDDVWVIMNRFFSESIPAFDIAKDMILTVDLPDLVNDCKNLIAFTKKAPHLLVSPSSLTDNENLSLQLLAGYVGHRLGILESDTFSKEKLQAKLGKSSKIVSTRLGELVRSEIATKTDDGKYKITAFGVTQMQERILPKIKEKISI